MTNCKFHYINFATCSSNASQISSSSPSSATCWQTLVQAQKQAKLVNEHLLHEEKGSRMMSTKNSSLLEKTELERILSTWLFSCKLIESSRWCSENTFRQRTNRSWENRQSLLFRLARSSHRTEQLEEKVGERSLCANDNPRVVFWQLWTWAHTQTQVDIRCLCRVNRWHSTYLLSVHSLD